MRVDAWRRASVVTGAPISCVPLFPVLLFRFHQRDKWPYGDTERNRAAAGRAKKLSLQSPRRDLKEPQGSENWYEKVHYQVAKHTSGPARARARSLRTKGTPLSIPSSLSANAFDPHPTIFHRFPLQPSRADTPCRLRTDLPVQSLRPSTFPAAEFQITADLRGFVQSDYHPLLSLFAV